MKQLVGTWSFAMVLVASLLGASFRATGNESKYIRHSGEAKTVIVFVHGVLGDSQDTWTNGTSYWPSLIAADTAFNDADIFVYSYPTAFWATMSIDELAEDMRIRLSVNNVSDYSRVIFLSHSMGGLITRAYLLKNRDVSARTLFLYFLSTPTTGSQIASIAAIVSRNPQLGKMKPMNAEDYLADVVRQWLAAELEIPSYCAYEKRSTYGLSVVTMQSASALCTKALAPIDANHIDISKPADMQAGPYVAFKVAYMHEGADPLRRLARVSPAQLSSFVGMLRQRADAFTSALDGVIATLATSKGIVPEEAQKIEQDLQRIRRDFMALQKKHIDAVYAGDVLLTHELVGQLHELQSEAVTIVGSRIGTIGRKWYAMLGRQYVRIPSPSEDPKYHAVAHDVGRLREATSGRLTSAPYPGDVPASMPSEISILLFDR